jgi:hypothetical protein
MYRVIHWGPGNVGRSTLRTIIKDPRFQLVGVRVYSESKEGRDAGDLVGLDPVGIAATRDVDALLALEADCIAYTASDMQGEGPERVIDEVCTILRSGKNVVGTAPTQLLLPESHPDVAAKVAAACHDGGASFHITGLSPGFMDDYLPTKLATGCVSFDHIATEENLCLLPFYSDPATLRRLLGIGNTAAEEDAHRDDRLRFGDLLWRASPMLIAHAFGVEVEEVKLDWEYSLATSVIEHPPFRIEVGQVAAVHATLHAVVEGKIRISSHHYERLVPEAAPEWPAPPGNGGYRIVIKGEPSMTLDVAFDDDPMTGGNIFTGARVAACIPAVCDATPGLHTVMTLPYGITGQASNWVCERGGSSAGHRSGVA